MHDKSPHHRKASLRKTRSNLGSSINVTGGMERDRYQEVSKSALSNLKQGSMHGEKESVQFAPDTKG